ncbi:Zona pellucida sperm-binding protein 3 [Nibea albiflora]|uniref:Zona pellucida sperm-binding protein 3 n=1 Tax=Nibea albiflora TaxID=240163 RepID=A0ACB7FDG8_NIBAL|nr:Zona pellucida sperm-binding protein 3 [Nibea albiflora]
MAMKHTAVCLVALALLGSFCHAQFGSYKPSKPSYQKPSPPVKQEPTKQLPQQPQQAKQEFEKPITWKYPEDPQPEPQPEVPFELRHPVAAATVAVECREIDAHIEAKKDLFGIGQFINPNDLTLGTCNAVAEDTAAQVLIFESELHACGSTLDWQYERPSYQYFLGDLINIEAIVKEFFHVPLRVYVDSCVATASADMNSSPRYAFIENHGCLVDARITGSSSKFMARTVENKLQFQLEAFRFQGSDSGLLYITCHLKATSAAYTFDGEHRACSYINGWKEASGAHAACDSCESGGFDSAGSSSGVVGAGASTGGWGSGSASGGSLATPGRKIRDVTSTEVFEWEGDVTLGPFVIGERVVA